MDHCGNYLIEDVRNLGSGSFGEVFECKVFSGDMRNMKIYARKYFRPNSQIETHIREVADLRDRFIFEISKQCEFNQINHNSIAPIVLFKTDIECPFFVMEKAECNLDDSIKKGMSEDQKKNSILDICSGLKTIHSKDYVHRDLKPQNILYYGDGKFKITDFGLLKDLDTLRAEIQTRFDPKGMGTQGYIAPEIIDSGSFSKESDIYAIGKIIKDVYQENQSYSLRKVISKCCNFLAEERYSNSDELVLDFLKAVGVNK